MTTEPRIQRISEVAFYGHLLSKRKSKNNPIPELVRLVLQDGLELDPALGDRINGAISQGLSPRHLPDEIYQVAEIPRTLSGKKLEVPVKRILSGIPIEEAVSKGAVANPDTLLFFMDLAGQF